MAKNITAIINDRRLITHENLSFIVGALVDISDAMQKAGLQHVANKLSLYVKALKSERDWDTIFATANFALSYVQEVDIRTRLGAKRWDLRKMSEGDWLHDGAIVQKCPACGKMGLVRDYLDDQSYTAHEVIVKPGGYEVKEQCKIPPRPEIDKELV